MTALAPVYAALGDPVRLELVNRLCGGTAVPLHRLAEGLPMSRQAVTKHLRQIESAGLAVSEKRGRESLWRARPDRLRQAQRGLERIAQGWDDALARLAAHVEDRP